MSNYTPEQLRGWADKMEARLDPTSDPDQLRAHATALERIKKMESAIRWALGYNEGEPQFQPRKDGDPPYWWRDELMRRADFPKETR